MSLMLLLLSTAVGLNLLRYCLWRLIRQIPFGHVRRETVPALDENVFSEDVPLD
jgi:hypothetical protein